MLNTGIMYYTVQTYMHTDEQCFRPIEDQQRHDVRYGSHAQKYVHINEPCFSPIEGQQRQLLDLGVMYYTVRKIPAHHHGQEGPRD